MSNKTENHLQDPNFCGLWAEPRLRSALLQMQADMDELQPRKEEREREGNENAARKTLPAKEQTAFAGLSCGAMARVRKDSPRVMQPQPRGILLLANR